MTIAKELLAPPGGHFRLGALGPLCNVIGGLTPMAFEPVATIGAGAALTTIQGTPLFVPFNHRLRAVQFAARTLTAVSLGTDPSADVYRHLPASGVLTGAALESPAVAGLVEDGVHLYALVFYNGTGAATPGPVVSVTVTDKTTNGKVRVPLAIGPTGTVGRRLYRTEAAGAALKLVHEFAENTTETYLDNLADISLGAAAPTANASGLTVLSATVKFTAAAAGNADRVLIEQPLYGTLAAGVAEDVMEPCMYTLRALTGGSTGALGDLQSTLWIEVCDY